MKTLTIDQHIEQNRQNIETEARIYAANFGCSMEVAIRDVTDHYTQGWHDEADAMRYGDLDQREVGR